jgi:hypothetical protein
MNLPDLIDEHGENRRSAVCPFIPVHTSDDGVLKVHVLDCLCYPTGFEPVHFFRGAVFNVAETT